MGKPSAAHAAESWSIQLGINVFAFIVVVQRVVQNLALLADVGVTRIMGRRLDAPPCGDVLISCCASSGHVSVVQRELMCLMMTVSRMGGGVSRRIRNVFKVRERARTRSSFVVVVNDQCGRSHAGSNSDCADQTYTYTN